jgi:hypothetical protein
MWPETRLKSRDFVSPVFLLPLLDIYKGFFIIGCIFYCLHILVRLTHVLNTLIITDLTNLYDVSSVAYISNDNVRYILFKLSL